MRPEKKTLVTSLGLVAAWLSFAAGGCGGEVGRREQPRSLPEEQRMLLEPSVYSSEEFEPSLVFKLGEGWSTSSSTEMLDEQFLYWRGSAGLGFGRIQEVYEPTSTGTPSVADAPEGLVGWFERHPYLRTDRPEPVAVGGVEGVRFGVAVGGDVPEDHHGVCGPGCVDIARTAGGSARGMRGGEKVRVIVL